MVLAGILFLLILAAGIAITALLAGLLVYATRRSGTRLPLARLAAGGLLSALLVGAAVQALMTSGLPEQWIEQASQWYEDQNMPRRVVQVNLASFQAVSQYHADIAGMFGANGCGLIAPAQAVLASSTGLADTPENRAALAQQMEAIRVKAVRPDGSSAYGPVTGIQPAELAQALMDSGYRVSVHDQWNLKDMYRALADGEIVIVDIRINTQAERPGTAPDTLAHFTRVLGMDLDKQEIYLENTLTQNSSAYWTLSLTDFLLVWQHPETQATIKPSLVDPSIQVEDVTQWAMIIER